MRQENASRQENRQLSLLLFDDENSEQEDRFLILGHSNKSKPRALYPRR